jgi:hypothetical protein
MRDELELEMRDELEEDVVDDALLVAVVAVEVTWAVVVVVVEAT